MRYSNRNLIRIIVLIVFFSSAVFAIFYTRDLSIDTTESPLSESEKLKAEIELGKQLFVDKRLSRDQSISCVSCHLPELAFTDGKIKSIGIYGQKALRNAPSLYNISEAPYFMQDGGVPTLEMQAIVPIQDLTEMGFTMKELIARLKTIPKYRTAAKRIYNREIDAWVITRSIAAFEKTLISKNSRFDQYLKDSVNNPLSQSELQGWKLFSKELNCVKCHSIPNLTNYKFETNFLTKSSIEDPGRFRISNKEEERGRFKVPSLRNISLTAPYMHDGSYSDLKSVLDAYFNSENPILYPKNTLSNKEIESIIDFFGTLIDTSFVDLTGF